MATTKTATTAKVEEKTNIDNSTAAMEKKIADLQAQIELMTKMMSNASQAPVEQHPVQLEKERMIPFVNLTKGTLVLRGSTVYKIEGQFTKRNFVEREARLIVNNTHNAVEHGCVYIADAEFVKEMGLDSLYETLLSDEDLKNLLKRDIKHICAVYENASKWQKELIISMVENKILNKEDVDLNILKELSQLSGKDLVNMQPLE